jgi:hypothetical protein
MKLEMGTALVASCILAGAACLPASLMAAEPADAARTAEAATTDARDANRQRAEREQAEAAEHAANAVRSATKLDLDIRLIGPTSVAGEL